MLIVRLMGGLGNQLQQYSLYRRMVEAGLEARLDTSWFDASVQRNMLAPRQIEIDRLKGVSYVTATPEEIKAVTGGLLGKIKRKLTKNANTIFREEGRMYIEDLVNGIFVTGKYTNMLLEGYFACEFYHETMLPKLRSELSFPVERHSNPDELKRVADDIKCGNSIAVHIRRGDYLDAANAEYFGGICTDIYYTRAIDYMSQNVKNPRFFVFSDDLAYAEKFKEDLINKERATDVTLVDINKDNDNYFDIYLMSLCRHNIVANSTFSFWGARLNANEHKIMIRPTIHRNGQQFDRATMKEWWKGWIFVSPEGELFS